MPLTPQEEQELAALEAEEQRLSTQSQQSQKNLAAALRQGGPGGKEAYTELMRRSGVTPEGVEKAIQTAGVGLAGMAMPAANFLGRSALSGLTGVAGEKSRTPQDALTSFLTGAAAQAVPEAVGKGLRKIGDVGMQAAVGRTKYTPGVGEQLAEEGLFGTKAQMSKQVKKGLTGAGQQLDEVAASIPQGSISSPKIAQEIWEEQSRPFIQNVGYKPSAAAKKDLGQIADYVADVNQRGFLSGPEAVGYGRSAGRIAYGLKDQAGATTAKQLAKTEQAKLSEALKQADTSGQYEAAAKRYAALKKAEAGLDKEDTIRKSMLGLLSTPVDALPLGNLASSGISRAAIGTGKQVEKLPEMLRLFQAAKE